MTGVQTCALPISLASSLGNILAVPLLGDLDSLDIVIAWHNQNRNPTIQKFLDVV